MLAERVEFWKKMFPSQKMVFWNDPLDGHEHRWSLMYNHHLGIYPLAVFCPDCGCLKKWLKNSN